MWWTPGRIANDSAVTNGDPNKERKESGVFLMSTIKVKGKMHIARKIRVMSVLLLKL